MPSDTAAAVAEPPPAPTDIALEEALVSACEAGDKDHNGVITVDEIVTAVHNALSGCG